METKLKGLRYYGGKNPGPPQNRMEGLFTNFRPETTPLLFDEENHE